MSRARVARMAAVLLTLAACRGGDNGLDLAPTGGLPGTGGGGGTGGSPAVAPADIDEASIVTWNLESYPLTPDAEAKAALLLNQLAADVVALQEITEPAAFQALLDRLPEYDGVLNDDPGAYIRVGLLWRKDRVTVDEVETLFASDWYAFPRPPLKARITIDAPHPIDFVTVVLHLKAQLDDDSAARRRVGCERLEAWVDEQVTTSDEADYVLIGDLNDKVTDPPQWNVFNVFLDRPEAYTFLTMPAAAAGEHTYIPFESFIDHVLVTADTLDEVGTGHTEVLDMENEIADYRDLTDHRPVRTWLRW